MGLMGVYDKSLSKNHWLAYWLILALNVDLQLYTASTVSMRLQLPTKHYVCEINNGTFTSYEFDSKEYGFEYADKTELEGGDAAVNAEGLLAAFSVNKVVNVQAVLLNAGMAIYLAKEGLTLARVLKKRAKQMIERFGKSSCHIGTVCESYAKRYNH